MKKLSRIFLIVVTASIFISSCREQSTSEKVEDAVEDVVDDVEDAVD